MFQAGQYEDGVESNSSWATGDWDGDGDFRSSDLILAASEGRYEAESGAVGAVPEPSSASAFLVGLAVLALQASSARRFGGR